MGFWVFAGIRQLPNALSLSKCEVHVYLRLTLRQAQCVKKKANYKSPEKSSRLIG
jgi:hypothetical protein